MAIRLRIGALLQERQMSTRQFADEAGIGYNTALNLQRGNINHIRFTTLDRICAALGVTPGDIFEYEPAAAVHKPAKKKPSG